MIGMRVAAFVCKEWGRAEVISEVNRSKEVKLFFIDYGTSGFVGIRNCKMLVEEYAMVPKQAIRAALHGIKPVRNCRLWNLRITKDFIKMIKNKSHEIEIVSYHEHVS